MSNTRSVTYMLSVFLFTIITVASAKGHTASLLAGLPAESLNPPKHNLRIQLEHGHIGDITLIRAGEVTHQCFSCSYTWSRGADSVFATYTTYEIPETTKVFRLPEQGSHQFEIPYPY